MQAGMGITDGIIQGKISCFRNKFHKHKEKCSEKRKFLGALCLRSEQVFQSEHLLFCFTENCFPVTHVSCYLHILFIPDIYTVIMRIIIINRSLRLSYYKSLRYYNCRYMYLYYHMYCPWMLPVLHNNLLKMLLQIPDIHRNHFH